MINGEAFRVRNVRECDERRYSYRVVKRRVVRGHMHGPDCGHAGYGGSVVVDGGYGYGGGYAVRGKRRGGNSAYVTGYGDVVIGGGSSFIGSPAAVAQARRRANSGYYAGGAASYNDGDVVIIKKKGKRRRGASYNAGYGYNYGSGYGSGVVVHTGPVIMKDGGY